MSATLSDVAPSTVERTPTGSALGVVTVLPGRSGAAAYGPLADRLAAAGYLVRAEESPAPPADLPHVLLGEDTGAVEAVRRARRTPAPAVVVLAGLPGPAERGPAEDGPGHTPTLVVHGELDLRSPSLAARALAARWPRARFVTVPGSGHDVLHTEHRAIIAEEIVGFVERIRTGRPPARTIASPLRLSIRSTL